MRRDFRPIVVFQGTPVCGVNGRNQRGLGSEIPLVGFYYDIAFELELLLKSETGDPMG
jgi:hypothetical protein